MRRYSSLLLFTVLFLLVWSAGSFYLAGYADDASPKTRKSLTLYTTLPVEHAAALAQAYEKMHPVALHFVPLSREELLEKLSREPERADAVLADRETLQRAAHLGAFSAHVSELTDIVPQRFKDEQGAWVGVWYDPMVFCVNRDYLKALPAVPAGWEELAALRSARIGMTDFLAADAASNLLFTMVAERDEAWAFRLLSRMHPRVVQYAKFLGTPARMAGMGEVDVAVAVQSESIRYISDGFPIQLIYPKEGTAYMLTGVGVLKGTDEPAEARQLVQWLLGDDVQTALQSERFFFIPTNGETLAYKSFSGKNLRLFTQYTDLSEAQKRGVLDRWVKNIRFQ